MALRSVCWPQQSRVWQHGPAIVSPRQEKTTTEVVIQGEVFFLEFKEPLPEQLQYSSYFEGLVWGLTAGTTDPLWFPVVTAFTTAQQLLAPPAWYWRLDSDIHEQVTYDPEEGYPIADDNAMVEAAAVVRRLYAALGVLTPEPYFDVAPDRGVDVYFDYAGNELQVHLPPAGSQDYYLFYRVGGERAVERCSGFDEAGAVEILRCVVGMDGLQTR